MRGARNLLDAWEMELFKLGERYFVCYTWGLRISNTGGLGGFCRVFLVYPFDSWLMQ